MIGDSDTVTIDSEQRPKIGYDESEWTVKFLQNRRLRSRRMNGHDGAEYAASAALSNFKEKAKAGHLMSGFGKEELADLSEPYQKDSRCILRLS